MPSANDHDESASRNETFLEFLGAPDTAWPEWAIIVVFYAAVQHTQAACVRYGWRVTDPHTGRLRPPRYHPERLTALDGNAPPLADIYRSLQNWSEGARYDCETFTTFHVSAAMQQLSTLKAEIANLAP